MLFAEPVGITPEIATYHYREQIPMWAVYKHPSDWPHGYVARLHISLPAPAATNAAIYGGSLQEIREALPRGLIRIERHPQDEEHIVEAWV